MHFLDTDTLTHAHLGHRKVVSRIGCITLAHRATLVTRNYDHFRQIPGLKIENWAD